MKNTVNADMIRQALENTYQTPEWYLGFEVGNSTGSNCRRHADAVAINAYPSRGFETRGFEIKVSKQDLAAELDNGIKSDEIARFCDYWFLVVPKGLADSFSLPPTWGVIEYHEGKLRQKTRAKKLEKINPTPGFLCAFARGRERLLSDLADKAAAKLESEIERRVEWRNGNAQKELKELKERLEKIHEETGIRLSSWTPEETIINRLNAAKNMKVIPENIRSMKLWADNLLKDAQEIEAAVDQILIDQKEQAK